jgi:arylsulfatase A-like enzyme
MRNKFFLRSADFLLVITVFFWAAYRSKIHAGLFPIPLIPPMGELPMLALLGIAWQLAARTLELYEGSMSAGREAIILAKLVVSQVLFAAVVLFFMKSLVLNRFFLLLYAAGLFGSTTIIRWAGRAWNWARHTPMKFLVPVAGCVVLVAAGLVFLFSPVKPPRPNIILISIDTLRADRLGCYGCPTGTSPNIDAFSRESVQFLWAISQAPSTSGSHMSLFTGLLPPVHRVTNLLAKENLARIYEISKLSAKIPTLAQYLRENGYRTIGLHSGGHVSAFYGFGQGFDLYSDKIINWGNFFWNRKGPRKLFSQLQESRKAEKPFFLFIHHFLCHDPYISAPRQVRERFLANPEPGLPVEHKDLLSDMRGHDSPPAAAADSSDEPQQLQRWILLHDSFWKKIDGNNPRHRQHVRALYDAGVCYSDMIFGKVVGLLKSKGLYDQTLIAVVSDHGEEFWEHGGTLHKNLFVETLHVPLLVKFPGGKYGGRKIETPVSQYDLMPTILEYLGITPRLKPQAKSLLPLIRNTDIPGGRVLSFDDTLQFLRFRQGGVSYSNQTVRGIVGEWMYDHMTDPYESDNLAGADMGRVIPMRKLAVRIMNDQRKFRVLVGGKISAPGQLPEDLKRQLKALGYL